MRRWRFRAFMAVLKSKKLVLLRLPPAIRPYGHVKERWSPRLGSSVGGNLEQKVGAATRTGSLLNGYSPTVLRYSNLVAAPHRSTEPTVGLRFRLAENSVYETRDDGTALQYPLTATGRQFHCTCTVLRGRGFFLKGVPFDRT